MKDEIEESQDLRHHRRIKAIGYAKSKAASSSLTAES